MSGDLTAVINIWKLCNYLMPSSVHKPLTTEAHSPEIIGLLCT